VRRFSSWIQPTGERPDFHHASFESIHGAADRHSLVYGYLLIFAWCWWSSSAFPASVPILLAAGALRPAPDQLSSRACRAVAASLIADSVVFLLGARRPSSAAPALQASLEPTTCVRRTQARLAAAGTMLMFAKFVLACQR